MKNYQGQTLIDKEAETLLEFEIIIGKSILFRELKYESLLEFGFFCENGSVIHLNLQKCGLKQIPKCISNFHHITHLNLSDNFIQKIENLESISTLEKLNLGSSYRGHGNYIDEIQGLEYLKKLKSLYLENNYIRIIKNLERLQSLESLNLINNYIDVIDGIVELKMLKKLYLNGNFITDLSEIEAPPHLDFIALENNSLPLEFEIELIVMSNCSIKKIKEYYEKSG